MAMTATAIVFGIIIGILITILIALAVWNIVGTYIYLKQKREIDKQIDDMLMRFFDKKEDE